MKTTFALLVATLFVCLAIADMANYEDLVFDQGSCYIARGTAITGHRFPNGTKVRNDPVNATLAVNSFDRLFLLDLAQYGVRVANETHAYIRIQVRGNSWVPVPTNYADFVRDTSYLSSRGARDALTNNFQDSYSTTADHHTIYYSMLKSKFECNKTVALSIGQTPPTPVVANGGYNVYYYSERETSGGPSGSVFAYDEARFTGISLECITYEMLGMPDCELANATCTTYESFCSTF